MRVALRGSTVVALNSDGNMYLWKLPREGSREFDFANYYSLSKALENEFLQQKEDAATKLKEDIRDQNQKTKTSPTMLRRFQNSLDLGRDRERKSSPRVDAVKRTQASIDFSGKSSPRSSGSRGSSPHKHSDDEGSKA